MRRVPTTIILALASLVVVSSALASSALSRTADAKAKTGIDWTPVGQAIGIPGKVQKGGVYRIDVPRTDLKVMLKGTDLKPSFALGGYLVFLSTGSGMQAMMMGDLVLTESEIEPVMLKLEQGGVDGATLDKTIGTTGKISGGVYKFSIPPTYTIKSMGMTIPPAMGMNTGLAFQPLGKGRAAVTGDFTLRGNQINPVIRALRTHGISLTALHSHILDATPSVFFMHFYATGNAVALARGLRAGLDTIAANPATGRAPGVSFKSALQRR